MRNQTYHRLIALVVLVTFGLSAGCNGPTKTNVNTDPNVATNGNANGPTPATTPAAAVACTRDNINNVINTTNMGGGSDPPKTIPEQKDAGTLVVQIDLNANLLTFKGKIQGGPGSHKGLLGRLNVFLKNDCIRDISYEGLGTSSAGGFEWEGCPFECSGVCQWEAC